ncbi:Ig-like domain-containing protein [Luteolibacter arcticus]|uniref:Ig-like domain-containing protein n=1 Tax=Luteolibacter arcticus TaxID=1581411 RepID=A0ABT3GQY6_9BACT|nr:Ig-like domain-containing protein [Luteolibacter arcticus]MCW1925897.1 Ig-like domain-containing protein [Luteolibacter arcticus]
MKTVSFSRSDRAYRPAWRGRAALASMLLPAAGMAAVSDGLTHQWNFDESRDWHDSPFATPALPAVFQDMVGGQAATPVGLDNTAVVSGREFMALSFSGNGTRLQVGQNLAPELGVTSSLAFWMRTTATGGSDQTNSPGVTGSAAGSGGIQWGWLDANGRLCLSADGSLLAQSPQAVNDGNWHFVVMTRNSSTGAGQLYLDGSLVDSRTGPTGARTLAFQSLGRIENTSGNAGCFVGRLDKLTVFNRVITGAEVTSFMNNHAPKTWNLTTDGVNDRVFSTDSVFKRAYDVERNALTVQGWTTPAHGTVSHNGDGSFNYTATGGYAGTDSFDVTVSDGVGGYHRSSLTVKVVAEPPGGGGIPVTQFTNFAAIQAGGVDISHANMRVPRAIDWNVDGKMDILVGAGGYVWRYLNTGTAAVPAFAAAVKVQAAGVDIYANTTGNSPITLADMTGDGVPDLVMADSASKLRVYRNTAAAGATPVYAASIFVKRANGTIDFVLPDKRFDIGDYNGDGTPDLVTGTFSGNVQLYLNVNTAALPRFETGTTLNSDSYNLYPRLYDLSGNGQLDLIRSINWGSIRYWLDVADGLVGEQYLNITTSGGTAPDIKAVTDGAVVDFADFTGDGKPDLLVGGHAGDKIFLASGVLKSPAESIADIEAIYDAHPTDLGTALSANSNLLLGQVNSANLNIIAHLQKGTLSTREATFTALAAHIAKYPFLKYQQLDTAVYHHVPSIVLQNWVILEYLLPNTSARRTQIADIMGLTGTARVIYLETGMALGDNGKSLAATYNTIRDFQRRYPREAFPDAIMTYDQLYDDQRGGFIWTPNSTKNTFGQWALGNANEWAGDLTTAIEGVLGAGKASGDYFTFVMGHEVCHSLDNYVRTRANADLERRWGARMVYAAGPDVIAGSNGWYSQSATQANFQAKGFYTPATQTWAQAWDAYWETGPGAAFNSLASMRIDIKFFLGASQESLATQANHHWANGHGRLIGALDRFRRAEAQGIEPMKANMTEVVDFIDYISAGMNRVNLVETKNPTGSNVVWTDHYADLERDENGRITRIAVDGEVYNFTLNADGLVTDATSTIVIVKPDIAVAVTGQGQAINVLANDTSLHGPAVPFSSFTQPAHGTVTDGGNGVLIYRSTAGYTGADSFTYTAGGDTANVSVTVVANANGLSLETWLNIGGDAVTNLTGNNRYPSSPDQVATISTFETTTNRGDNYGARVRGYVTPPTTGNYTFWIASDDGGELWLSTDANPSNKTKIAFTLDWTGVRVWTTYASQQSAVIPLTAGQRYYVEVLHKEGGGGDNLAVAWQGPGITQQVIGTNRLTAFGLNNNPVANADNAATNQNAAVSVPVLANDSDSNGDTLVIQSVTQPAHGTAAIDGSSILYTPALNYSGSDSLSYTASDGNGGTATANLAITIAPTTYTLAYIAGPNGVISGTTPQTVNYGTSGSAVAAVANVGYHFVDWSDGITTASRTDSNVTANLSVTANFAINTYTLTYTAGANGTLSGTTPQTVNYGASSSSVTAVANAGYGFTNWSDGSTANPRTDTNVTANLTVTANFTATGPGPIPAPWTDAKIGTVAAATSATYLNGTFNVTGGGSRISNTSDNFYFVSQPWSGTGTITARVVSLQNTGSAARAGVMMRESSASGSRSVFIGLTPANSAQWVRRSNTGGNSSTTTSSGKAAPYWVRLTREGNTITSYLSANGTTWTQLASANISMSASYSLGLAACSGASGTTVASVFDNVSVSSTLPPPPEVSPTTPEDPLPKIEEFTLEDGTVDFNITGEATGLWTLEESTDFLTWSPLQTMTLEAGGLQHSEADERGEKRFLRLRSEP